MTGSGRGHQSANASATPSEHGHRPNSVPAPWAKRILWGLFALCALLALLDVPALIRHWRYEEHPWEALPLLYPLWGFVGISLLIVLSKGLRRLVMRPEDYYEGDGPGAPDADVADAPANADAPADPDADAPAAPPAEAPDRA